MNARLSEEGGSARLPPSLITSSTLFQTLEKTLGETRVQYTGLATQLNAMVTASSTYLTALKALTAMDVAPMGGGCLGEGGVLSGAFVLTTQEPVNGKTVSFTLDFYTAEDTGSSLVEYTPREGVTLLPEFLHVSWPAFSPFPTSDACYVTHSTHTPPLI